MDALKGLQDVAGIGYSQTQPCPELGEAVAVAIASGQQALWGDLDCDGDVDAVDALQALRYLAGFGANQAPGCPSVGAMVLIDT